MKLISQSQRKKSRVICSGFRHLGEIIMLLIFLFTLALSPVADAAITGSVNSSAAAVAIAWRDDKPAGRIEVLHGRLAGLKISKGRGRVDGDRFVFSQQGENRLEIRLLDANAAAGRGATVVGVRTNSNAFSFFLRDVSTEFPVWIPAYGVAVLPAGDNRSCAQIEEAVTARELKTKRQIIDAEPEESFENAAPYTRDQPCPTWLGLGRDIRIFEIALAQDMEIVYPKMASQPVNLPERGNRGAAYCYLPGRGQGVDNQVMRRLEEGVLPILHVTRVDEEVEYITTQFVSLEHSALNAKTVSGTHYLVADNYCAGHMFTHEQQDKLKTLLQEPTSGREETVLFVRTVATNNSSVPRYAWFKTIKPGRAWYDNSKYTFDRAAGFSSYGPDRVFAVSRFNGTTMPDEEMAVLLKPHEKAVFDFYLPHQPVSADRAKRLAEKSFTDALAECKAFWLEKLSCAGRFELPEKRINEMVQAGLLHLDLITYGLEPDSTLAPAIGVYSPIGTESSPIIQFYNSMGLHDMAKRACMYFLDKQHADGMIQNFGGYMVETGAALWTMGEYFRYTRDREWILRVKTKLLKACDFLIAWRNRNKKESLANAGYGMIDGKVADPEDPYHQYMLNGYAYLGISRIAEILQSIDEANARRLGEEADAWKMDIRTCLLHSMAGSPVVPLGDGAWSPTVPPWPEARAMRLLYSDGEPFQSHGTVTVSDGLLGPLYLVFCEVLDPGDPVSRMMLEYHQELFFQRNAAFSQPYYSRHNWLQLKLGMTKSFLKTYYNTFSALADRQTYTFWEHLYQASVHKTHEEAWFLMETRWMLYMEAGDRLKLLQGIPRSWLEDGKKISVTRAASYFGPLSFNVVSSVDKGWIEADVECRSELKPSEVVIRIPHPLGKQPVHVVGGVYRAEEESVIIKPFIGKAEVRIQY